mmetsp:Transcript_17336/g.24289  ORF Transcript_17336/g.24289 Transcript_17336/m.24289 type:complete len:123 (-) Transcript_17336:244-612(-)|eukprot:CAMPEP_0175104300 /NCGR_PEP_ID=MMETSP0086_2-20121207/9640_1 /TAXON_ID=136419 /ORGANISM="Unknown Unknown, Strain D1" /LENGTH=122 /DNA_ID=CAMNT_0016379655 /DNA_START=42 /DNA_END=410 /DNA_ORIENTATION=-
MSSNQNPEEGEVEEKLVVEEYAGPEPIIKETDMQPDMIKFAIKTTTTSLMTAEAEYKAGKLPGKSEQLDNVVAKKIKLLFDQEYTPTWHVVVGKNFGSHVVHESRKFVYFYLGSLAVLIFKS